MSEMDFAEGDSEAFHLWFDWFSCRHAADLLLAGFRTVAAYRALIGGMQVVDVLEASGWEIFDTERYRAMMPKDPHWRDILGRRVRKSHTVYTEQALLTHELAGGLPPIDADWITMTRYEADEQLEAAVLDWFSAHEAARLRTLGAREFRRGRRTRDHPRNPTIRPSCVIFVEWDRKPSGDSDSVEKIAGRFSAVVRADHFAGQRIYPWPDHAS
ncbi:MAG: hypothetical protein U1F15_14130 [Burkholderiales bacterium]